MAETAVHLGTTGTIGEDHRLRAGMAYDQEGRWLGAQIARPFPSSAAAPGHFAAAAPRTSPDRLDVRPLRRR